MTNRMGSNIESGTSRIEKNDEQGVHTEKYVVSGSVVSDNIRNQLSQLSKGAPLTQKGMNNVSEQQESLNEQEVLQEVLKQSGSVFYSKKKITGRHHAIVDGQRKDVSMYQLESNSSMDPTKLGLHSPFLSQNVELSAVFERQSVMELIEIIPLVKKIQQLVPKSDEEKERNLVPTMTSQEKRSVFKSLKNLFSKIQSKQGETEVKEEEQYEYVQKALPHKEIVQGGNDEQAYVFFYRTRPYGMLTQELGKSSRNESSAMRYCYPDHSTDGTNYFALEAVLPESTVKKLERCMRKNPDFMRTVVKTLMAEKLALPQTFIEEGQSQESPHWSEWKNFYLRSHKDRGFHLENILTLSDDNDKKVVNIKKSA